MNSKETSIGFSLLKISTEQFAIIEDGFNEKGVISVGTSLRCGADEKNKLIAVFSSFSFESDKKPFLIVEASCQFKITDDAWLNMLEQEFNLLKVPKGFLSHLAVLTIGTTRGILHARTEGTCFNKYVLPTINVTEIIKEDAIFSFVIRSENTSERVKQTPNQSRK